MLVIFFDYITIKIMNTFVSFHGEIFKTMHNHSDELAKQIVSVYVCIRLNITQSLKMKQ